MLSSAGAPPAPGTRLYSPAFGDQACGTVVNSAPQPDGGSLWLAVLQTEADRGGRDDRGARTGRRPASSPCPTRCPHRRPRRGRVKL